MLALRGILEYLDYVCFEGILVFFGTEQLVVLTAVLIVVSGLFKPKVLDGLRLGVEDVAYGVDIVATIEINDGLIEYVIQYAQF